jgi:hypothetical protein
MPTVKPWARRAGAAVDVMIVRGTAEAEAAGMGAVDAGAARVATVVPAAAAAVAIAAEIGRPAADLR